MSVLILGICLGTLAIIAFIVAGVVYAIHRSPFVFKDEESGTHSTPTAPNHQQDAEIFGAASVAFSPVIASILYAPPSASNTNPDVAPDSKSPRPVRDSYDDAASQRTLAPPSYTDARPKVALETRWEARVASA